MAKFTHLHVHSHYSLLQALPKIPELVGAAKKHGLEALALTDNGNLYGAIEFYKECKGAEIKPIIGIDTYVAGRTRFDKQAGVDKDRTRLILLAKNELGYKNLLKIVTASYVEGFYYKPRVDFDLLEKYSDGLLAISSSWSGDVSTALRSKNVEKALELVEKYKKIFNKNNEDNFYIELTMHPELTGHNEHMKVLAKFAKEQGVPVVAAHDIYYIEPEDRKARDTLMAVMQGAVNNNDKSSSQALGGDEDQDFSFVLPKEMKKRFDWAPDALKNVEKIVDECNLELELGKWVFPHYEIKKGLTHDDELRRITYEGIGSHGLKETPEIKERIEYELKVIKDKGYAPYFLVVGDLLRHAKDKGIVTTTRGSAGGSLVSYLNYITTLNPIEYDLPFERFLNPERPSAPDIDMDIADDRRDEMIAYAKEKYGENKVAQIGTFGTMMARGSVRDTARALGFEYGTGDRIAKLIPMGAQGFPMTIDKALKDVPELLDLYKKDADTKTIIDMAKKIEGCARHISVHAAGVVMSPTSITDFVPLQLDTKNENNLITQYDMHAVEDAGLLKFDFLGIKNLAILADSVHRVKKIEGIDIDIENIPLDDKKTFEMLAIGETVGVFQLNGAGMTRWLIELKPTVIFDLNVMVALYRPGPMDNINDYIARKHGKQKVTYLHPKMEKFLAKTFGVLVYQDDLLIAAIELAGYSWGEVDKFRKAVGKKIPEEMKKQHVKFVEGCKSYSNMTNELAEKIWGLFEPFQGYGFNKAHAASYGRVAYQTAYMKANFPAIYMSAVLTADSGDVDKVAESIVECKRMGIPVLPPDINESFAGFSVVKGKNEPDKIRFGLVTIKNFGEGIAETIINERKKSGPYKSMEDFLIRVQDKNLNKKSLEALVMSGAMDKFGERGTLLANTEILLNYSKESGAVNNSQSLFAAVDTGPAPLKLNKANEATLTDRLGWERELLGLYVSGHPLDKFREKIQSQKTTIKKVKEEMKEGDVVVIGGMLEEVKPYLTKNGDKMLFTKIADFTDTIEMAVFPRTLLEYPTIFNKEACIAVKAKVTLRNGEKSLIAEKAKIL